MRVLVASQDPVARRALTTLLQEMGHEPLPASEGEEAWRLLSRQPPPLALVDWALPGLDGPALSARLRHREKGPYVYLIAMGQSADESAALAALETGADDFLHRPLEPSLLKLRLRAAEHIVALHADFAESRQALEYKSTHDALTGTWNRAEVLGMLEREVARSQREGWPVCILMIDVDHFKSINDTYGHMAGDAALREITARLTGTLRPYDIIGRYGGEEFILVLGGCSPRNSLSLAERLRALIAGKPFVLNEDEVTITLSMGVAAWDATEHGDIQSLLRAADAALYRAKRAGRNRIEAAWEERPLLGRVGAA